MPSGRDIRAGGAFVEFSLRRRGLERSLRAVGRRLQRFGSNIAKVGLRIAALGTAITAPFALATRTFGKVGDDLEKLSRRTGFTVEALSELGFAAQQSGTDMDTLERAIKTMQRGIVDLGRGLSTQKDAFTELGLTFEDISSLSPEQQFTKIAEAISAIEDPTRRSAAAQVLFGRAGTKLLPLLNGGAQGIAELRQEARDLGIVIGGDTAKKAAEFTDAMGRIKSQAKVAAVNIGAALAPALLKVFEVLSKVATRVIEFVKENKTLIQVVAASGVAVTLLGAAVVGLGGVVIVAGVVLVKLAAVIGFLLSPLGLAVVAITAATIALFKFTSLGGQAAGFLRKRFAVLLDVVKRTFKGISDAFAGGDLLLAVRILWVNLQLAFLQGTQGLREKWIELKTNLVSGVTEAAIGVVGGFSNMLALLQSISIKVGSAFGQAWANLVGDAREAFNLAVLLAKRAGIAIRVAFDPTFSQADGSSANQRADSAFAAQQQADQRARRNQLATIESLRNAALSSIEAERVAREDAISQSLAIELEAIQTAADADKARIQARIDALRAERQELEQQAASARFIAEAIERARGLFRSGNGPGFGPEIDGLGGGIAAQVQQAAIAARGVTSSFSIRSLDSGGGFQAKVAKMGVKLELAERHLRNIDNNLKPGVQPGGLAIT